MAIILLKNGWKLDLPILHTNIGSKAGLKAKIVGLAYRKQNSAKLKTQRII